MECRRAPASAFPHTSTGTGVDSDSWYQYTALGDGSTYVRWDTVGEFLVAPDGRRVVCRRARRCSNESFQVYLLGQALSFALVKQRFEPLHATGVVVDGEGIAFLGGSGFGKSTLAAGFLAAGHRLLTDDQLILHESAGRLLAYPGPARIKLFPGVVRRFLGTDADGPAMNSGTRKLILRLPERCACAAAVPLKTIYCLAAPRDACRQQQIGAQALSARDAFVELIGNAFNRQLVGRTRLARQFAVMTRFTDLISVKKLVYPRTLDRLEEVREYVLDDLQRRRIAWPAPQVQSIRD